jgi:hypothetical protein
MDCTKFTEYGRFHFGLKPTRHFYLDNSDFEIVDNNDNTPSIIENSDVENVKLSR